MVGHHYNPSSGVAEIEGSLELMGHPIAELMSSRFSERLSPEIM